MKKLIIVAALAAIVAGCKSIEVERRAQIALTYADTNGVVHAVCDAKGNAVIIDGGWTVDYFQHWTWQRFDALTASAGADVSLCINNYQSGADSNLVTLVRTSFDGAALLAAKIGAAIATSGGTCAADGIASLVKGFVAKGGDTSKATVTCKDGSCTVTDGTVSETCTNCIATP